MNFFIEGTDLVASPDLAAAYELLAEAERAEAEEARRAATEAKQAACSHREPINIRTFGSGPLWMCGECGKHLKEIKDDI